MASGPVIEALGSQEDGNKYVDAWAENLKRFDAVDKDSLTGLLEVDRITSEIFAKDAAFGKLRDVLGEDENARTMALRAVTTHNFPSESDYPTSVYDGLLRASHVREQLSRAYISRLVEDGATFGLEQWERDVLLVSCQVGGMYDRLCDRWRIDVQRNPLNAQAKERGFANPYTVILDRLGTGPEEVPWSKAYPEEIENITDLWLGLAERLTEGTPAKEQIAMAAFLRTYVTALRSTDEANLPEQWREVDRTWMKVTGRVQPIPSREFDYYDKNKLRVFPDFRLAILVDDSLSEATKPTQAAQVKYLSRLFRQSRVFQQTLEGMSRVQLLPNMYDIVFSGSLDFQPAGQSLPNEQKVRDEAGTKVFLNESAMKSRWEVALEAAGKTFGDDLPLFERVDVRFDGLVIMTAGHEYGEPLFNAEWVTEALGPEAVAMLNEDLATQTITAILPMWEQETSDISRRDLQMHAVYLLGNYLRYIKLARGSEHLRPYYEGMGLLGLRRMIESGFIFQDEKKNWHVNMAQLDAFYAASLEDLKTQVRIAEFGDQMLVTRFLAPAEHMEKLPAIADLIAKITAK